MKQIEKYLVMDVFFILFWLQMYYVYILQWDKKYYVWITNNLKKRIQEHRNGKTKTTKSMWNISLIKYFSFSTRQDAAAYESKIKQSWHIERYI